MLRRQYHKRQIEQDKTHKWILIGSIFTIALLLGFLGCGKLSDDTDRPSTPVGTSGGSPVSVGPKSSVGTYSLSVTADPTSLPADSVNFSKLKATLSDSSGRSVQGYTVTFETQSGNIGWFLDTTSGTFVAVEQHVTDSNGEATARLYGVHSGTEVVNVGVDLDLDGFIDVSMTVSVSFTSSGPPSSAGTYSLSLWASKTSVPNDMATPSTIVATITDQWGGPVQDIQVNFTAELGYLVNNINNTTLSTETTGVTNERGNSSIYFYGQTPGSAVITARAIIPDLFGTLTDTILITVTGETPVLGPVTLALEVQYPNGQNNVETGQEATVVAFVTNSTGRPIPGASVSFSTSLGEVDPAIVETDASGYARTAFSSDTSGTANITATVTYVGGSASQQASATVNESVGTIVVAAPQTKTVTYGTDPVDVPLTATATVRNSNGDFMSGVNVSFSVTESCPNVTFSPTSTSATTDSGGLATYEITATVTGNVPNTCNYTVRATASGQDSTAVGTINVN